MKVNVNIMIFCEIKYIVLCSREVTYHVSMWGGR